MGNEELINALVNTTRRVLEDSLEPETNFNLFIEAQSESDRESRIAPIIHVEIKQAKPGTGHW